MISAETWSTIASCFALLLCSNTFPLQGSVQRRLFASFCSILATIAICEGHTIYIYFSVVRKPFLTRGTHTVGHRLLHNCEQGCSVVHVGDDPSFPALISANRNIHTRGSREPNQRSNKLYYLDKRFLKSGEKCGMGRYSFMVQ